jgi:enamine deaminase RidA (YjgF/YER057c/UK114 family)
MENKRITVSSGAPWEDKVGYCRAVRIGNTIEVAGTTAVDENGAVAYPNDLYQQTVFILQKIEAALKQCGATIQDVVRTRMFVTDISQWEAAGKAHGEVFRNIKPVTTMVEVKGLINPDLVIEIEATAICSA